MFDQAAASMIRSAVLHNLPCVDSHANLSPHHHARFFKVPHNVQTSPRISMWMGANKRKRVVFERRCCHSKDLPIAFFHDLRE